MAEAVTEVESRSPSGENGPDTVGASACSMDGSDHSNWSTGAVVPSAE